MLNIPELYINASENNPIETPIGNCYPVLVKDFDKLIFYQQWINKDKEDIFNGLLKIVKKQYVNEIRRVINEMNIFDFIVFYKETGFYEGYKDTFRFFFHEDVFDKIKNNEEFELYRELIRKLNCIKKEKIKKVNNPEIAYFQKLSQMVKERNGELITFKSIVTSVGLYRQDVNNMTIYQLYAYFDRIAFFKNNDATTLFSTVAEKVQRIPWYSDNIERYTQFNEQDKSIQNKSNKLIRNINKSTANYP